MKKFFLGAAVLGVMGATTLGATDAKAQVAAAAPYAASAIPDGYSQAQYLGPFNDLYSCQITGGEFGYTAVEYTEAVSYVLEFNGFGYVYVPVTQIQCWGLQTFVIAQPFAAKAANAH
jgi:hypothetical protein